MNISKSKLIELRKEEAMGSYEGVIAEKNIPVIDISNFDQKKIEITELLWEAGVDTGFFQIENHGIPLNDIDNMFIYAEKFFAMPNEIKNELYLDKNAGWEKLLQVRPSTGRADQKESYQITRPLMRKKWPRENHIPGFRESALNFEMACWKVGMQVLSCFEEKIGLPQGFFRKAHNPEEETYRSTLRLLHYYPTTSDKSNGWRAGAHTDFDCLTLLFQREGEDGLEVCPGKDMTKKEWIPIPAVNGRITCNIGDMLMRWSDDKLLSNFHRVKAPDGVAAPSRYSLAFFCQANSDVLISTASERYDPIYAEEYIAKRVQANYKLTSYAP